MRITEAQERILKKLQAGHTVVNRGNSRRPFELMGEGQGGSVSRASIAVLEREGYVRMAEGPVGKRVVLTPKGEAYRGRERKDRALSAGGRELRTGESGAARALGAAGGARRSDAKTAAAKANGNKGGRPKTKGGSRGL